MTTGYKKLLPTINPETKPYWDGCKRGELLIQRCNRCGKHQFYPRGFCSWCWCTDIGWVKSSGKGKVYTFTITYQNRSPGYSEEVPYVLALVELEEGVRTFSNIIECRPQDVQVEMPVEVVFKRATEEIAIPYFRPAKT